MRRLALADRVGDATPVRRAFPYAWHLGKEDAAVIPGDARSGVKRVLAAGSALSPDRLCQIDRHPGGGRAIGSLDEHLERGREEHLDASTAGPLERQLLAVERVARSLGGERGRARFRACDRETTAGVRACSDLAETHLGAVYGSACHAVEYDAVEAVSFAAVIDRAPRLEGRIFCRFT